MTIMQQHTAVMEREALKLDPFGGALSGVEMGLAKRTSIDLVDGKHEEELQHLAEQKKALETVVAKYPLLQQGLAEGWAEIRVHNGDLGIHYNGQCAVSAGAGESESDVEKKRAAQAIGNHFSVDTQRTRRTFAKAADPVDGEDLRDSVGF